MSGHVYLRFWCRSWQDTELAGVHETLEGAQGEYVTWYSWMGPDLWTTQTEEERMNGVDEEYSVIRKVELQP